MGVRFPYNEQVKGEHGAPMGRPNRGQPCDDRIALNCRRVLLDPYDGGGAYWGFGEPLWCFWTRDREVVWFIRAKHLSAAQASMLDHFPEATFYAC